MQNERFNATAEEIRREGKKRKEGRWTEKRGKREETWNIRV